MSNTNSKFHIGQKVWCNPPDGEPFQGRIQDIGTSAHLQNFALVKEDSRIRVDGPKRDPIYQWGRDNTGKVRMVPVSCISDPADK